MAITYRIGHDGRLSILEMDNNFEYIEVELGGLSSSVSQLEISVDNITTVIAGITASEAYQDATVIAGLTASVLVLEGDVVGLTLDVASATASIVTLNTNVAGATASIVTLNTNVASATASIVTLNTNVAGLTASVIALEAEVVNIELEATGLSASVDTLNTNVASATASITAINVVRNEFYVYPAFTGTSTGSKSAPYTTVTAALAAAHTAGYNDSNPAFIILLSSITEDINMTNGGIWLTSDFGTGTHGSVIVNGSITINGSASSISENHFSVSNLRVVPSTNDYGINFTGTNPQRVYMRDLWIDASGTSGACIYADNSGTGSVCHLNTAHLTHTGTGDVYCLDAEKGGMYLTDIETSGSNVQVAKVGSGAVLTLDSSEIDATGDAALECYGTGTVVVTRSTINNTKSGGHGIALNGTQSLATVGDCLFNIDNYLGTGKAVYGVTGSTLYYQNIAFFPFSNTKKSTGIISVTLSTSFTS